MEFQANLGYRAGPVSNKIKLRLQPIFTTWGHLPDCTVGYTTSLSFLPATASPDGSSKGIGLLQLRGLWELEKQLSG